MGLKECVITLDNPWNTYYPGQTVNGKADFTFDKPKKIRGISIKFKGVAEVKWTSTTQRRDHDGKSHSVTIDHTAEEEYFSITYYLLGSKTGNEIEIEGTRSFPFTCALPPTLPSSFEGEYGFVRYTVKLTLDRPWKFDQETKMAFTVTSHLDLNTDPKYRIPLHIQLEKTFCCCWCKSGPLSVDVRGPVSGYCSGQTIPLEINCENNSGVEVNNIVIQLLKFVTYRCRSPTSGIKEKEICICKIELGSIEGNLAKNFQKILEIPPLPPSNLANCSIIDVEYKIKAECNISGFHMDMDHSEVITLGTVPLVGFMPPPPDGQTENMLPSIPITGNISPETPLMSGDKAVELNAAYPIQNSPQINLGGNVAYPYPPQANPYPPQINPYAPQANPYPSQAAPYPPSLNMPQLSPQDNPYPSAPSLENQQTPNTTYPNYPGMIQPVFKEGQFAASNIHDSTDNQYTKISGNQVFAPKYPTYGFVMK